MYIVNDVYIIINYSIIINIVSLISIFKGWSYQEPKDDACCGECEQEFCVFEDTLYISGMTWSSSDNCTTYTCLKQDKQASSFRKRSISIIRYN